MPKINVYLPDDLAAAVREAKIPVSSVCQRALEQALQRATAVSEAARALVDVEDDAQLGLGGRLTPRLRAAIDVARGEVRERRLAQVGTEHLLLGLLEDPENLAVRVIRALDVEPDDLRTELEAAMAEVEAPAAKPPKRPKMTASARAAFSLSLQEALRLGHNYIGCEHLLLGLIEEDEGLGGRVLRSMGLDKTVTRRAVVSALSGFMHARAQVTASSSGSSNTESQGSDVLLREILTRLERLEARLEN